MDRTWRLPPEIVRFTSEYFYAGRLEAHSDCARQRLTASNAPPHLSGAGLCFEPVEHHGNVSSSPEEAERVAEIVSQLLGSGGTWTNRHGEERALTLADVLIVAPYNRQVELIRERLAARGHADARVGSVDKFQGQEAPLVLFSMATSDPADAPRGFEFSFSLNRLNVATSRAQAIAIIVASPRLLEAECKTPRQMRLVNGFCGAVQAARAAPLR